MCVNISMFMPDDYLACLKLCFTFLTGGVTYRPSVSLLRAWN